MRVVVAITGASGVRLGERFIEHLPNDIEVHLIATKNASVVREFENKNICKYENSNIASKIASGSFLVDATAIIPCSMNTLAKIANGIADNLVTRVASVAIKEQRKLLIAPRELPLSAITLENMLKLSRLNVIVSPPILGYYSDSNTLDEMEKFIIGKWYDSLGIKHNLYRRWEG
jgi:4-hydroxy-3-polyprenylbenzoate decarboxylase